MKKITKTDYKYRIYAIYQLLGFLSVIFVLLAVIPPFLRDEYRKKLLNFDEENYYFLRVFINYFKNISDLLILYTLFLVIGLLFYILSLICTILIWQDKKKTLYDVLFIIFTFVPILSNVLALIAMLSTKNIYVEISLNKEKITKKTLLITKNKQIEKINTLKDRLDQISKKLNQNNQK